MKRWSIFIAVLSASLLFWSAGIAHAATKTVNADAAGIITIPLSELSATARYYEFSDNGTTVRFLAVLSTDGSPRVAFDACEVCGGRLGYEQRGTDIRCRACGRVFRIDEVGSKNRAYGCWPSFLPFTERGKNVVIKAADLRKAAALFK